MRATTFFAGFFIFFILFSSLCFSEDADVSDDLKDFKKNALEINPMSDGIYIGLERVLLTTPSSLLILDAKNTTQSGKSFGQAGLTYRLGMTDKKLFSSRLQTAWQEGQKNIALKAGYDNPLFGFSVTGIKGLTDPEVVSSRDIQSTLLSSDTQETFTGTEGSYDVYERTTTTSNRVNMEETRFATPDGILVDIHLNVFRRLSFDVGGSYWESDSWDETGYHAALSWALTQDDLVGGHLAHVNDRTEGGVFYKKRFSDFGDIFRKGDPLPEGEERPLIQKMAAVPFSTPPIKILTAHEYVEETQETRTSISTEEIRVKRNNPPSITLFDAVSPVGVPGFLN
ncbi:MAG: hypothetical protein JW928_03185, partial [Candidatus Aureabacteria bacterium]|nr:hypothetical protein [Candidatus Auribacterota bacterium]